MWTHLERQSGGGQVKGMGEKQKEVDKRILRDQVSIQHYLIIVKVICMATNISFI
jgi:50S ribosomal subunit-associated GTPase HflX